MASSDSIFPKIIAWETFCRPHRIHYFLLGYLCILLFMFSVRVKG